jgi:TolB-like protein/tetratricopeptide (TPR) repeat protein
VSALQALGSISAELRRRHVFRVGLAYGAVAWAVTEVSATVLPALGVPDWSVTLVAALLILGLPIALALAWAFDLTPAGVERTLPRSRRRVRAGGPVAVLALPFADRSATGEHQYLGDGITEELINSLARMPGIRVVSRTSAFALRGSGLDLREMGERMGVSHVVEGSVGVADGRMRLTVQLVSVADGYATWSHTFDRALDSVFCVQEDIARALVGALTPALAVAAAGPRPRESLENADNTVRPGTAVATTAAPPGGGRDFETYALFLRGRREWNERTPASLLRALGCFSEAVTRDGSFAEAYAGIADCWAILVDHGIVAPAEGLPPAIEAADAALQRAPELAEAHASRGLVCQLQWRWAEAEAGFRTALALGPGCVTARQRLALFLAWRGRADEARAEIHRALRWDPLSAVVAASVGWIEHLAGNHEEAIRLEQRLLAELPDATPALAPLALALAAAGRAGEAVEVLQGTSPAGGGHDGRDGVSPLTGVLAYVLGRAGRRDEALELITRLAEAGDAAYVSPYVLARAWLGAGEPEPAITALEQAFADRSPQLIYLPTDAAFSAVRDDVRVRRIAAALFTTG